MPRPTKPTLDCPSAQQAFLTLVKTVEKGPEANLEGISSEVLIAIHEALYAALGNDKIDLPWDQDEEIRDTHNWKLSIKDPETVQTIFTLLRDQISLRTLRQLATAKTTKQQLHMGQVNPHTVIDYLAQYRQSADHQPELLFHVQHLEHLRAKFLDLHVDGQQLIQLLSALSPQANSNSRYPTPDLSVVIDKLQEIEFILSEAQAPMKKTSIDGILAERLTDFTASVPPAQLLPLVCQLLPALAPTPKVLTPLLDALAAAHDSGQLLPALDGLRQRDPATYFQFYHSGQWAHALTAALPHVTPAQQNVLTALTHIALQQRADAPASLLTHQLTQHPDEAATTLTRALTEVQSLLGDSEFSRLTPGAAFITKSQQIGTALAALPTEAEAAITPQLQSFYDITLKPRIQAFFQQDTTRYTTLTSHSQHSNHPRNYQSHERIQLNGTDYTPDTDQSMFQFVPAFAQLFEQLLRFGVLSRNATTGALQAFLEATQPHGLMPHRRHGRNRFDSPLSGTRALLDDPALYALALRLRQQEDATTTDPDNPTKQFFAQLPFLRGSDNVFQGLNLSRADLTKAETLFGGPIPRQLSSQDFNYILKSSSPDQQKALLQLDLSENNPNAQQQILELYNLQDRYDNLPISYKPDGKLSHWQQQVAYHVRQFKKAEEARQDRQERLNADKRMEEDIEFKKNAYKDTKMYKQLKNLKDKIEAEKARIVRRDLFVHNYYYNFKNWLESDGIVLNNFHNYNFEEIIKCKNADELMLQEKANLEYVKKYITHTLDMAEHNKLEPIGISTEHEFYPLLQHANEVLTQALLNYPETSNTDENRTYAPDAKTENPEPLLSFWLNVHTHFTSWELDTYPNGLAYTDIEDFLFYIKLEKIPEGFTSDDWQIFSRITEFLRNISLQNNNNFNDEYEEFLLSGDNEFFKNCMNVTNRLSDIHREQLSKENATQLDDSSLELINNIELESLKDFWNTKYDQFKNWNTKNFGDFTSFTRQEFFSLVSPGHASAEELKELEIHAKKIYWFITDCFRDADDFGHLSEFIHDYSICSDDPFYSHAKEVVTHLETIIRKEIFKKNISINKYFHDNPKNEVVQTFPKEHREDFFSYIQLVFIYLFEEPLDLSEDEFLSLCNLEKLNDTEYIKNNQEIIEAFIHFMKSMPQQTSGVYRNTSTEIKNECVDIAQKYKEVLDAM